jgi:autotransporter-associated beta strand protein
MKPTKNIPHHFQILFPLCALLTAATSAVAQTDTWTGGAGDNNWATPGNWNLTLVPTTGETPVFGAKGAGGLTLNNNLTAGTSFLGLDFNVGAPAFTLNGNAITTTGGIFDYSTSLETINFGMLFSAASHSLYAGTGGTLVVNGVISDGGSGYGITATGGGLVSLTQTNNYIGTTAVNAGTLELDFNTLGINSEEALSNNIIDPGSALSLGGGTLNMNGSGTLTNSQTFASTTVAAGSSVVQVAPASGTVTISNNLALGAFTYTTGSSVMFVGPASSTGVTTASGQSGAYGNQNGTPTAGFVTNTANITTTAGAVNTELTGSAPGVSPGTGTSAQAAFATVGLYDFAIVVGSSPFTIIGASQGTAQTGDATAALTGANSTNGFDGAYTLVNAGQLGGSGGGAGGPYDCIGACATRNTDSLTAVRFNANGVNSIAGSTTWSCGGILVTPNVAQNNNTITVGLNGGLRGGNAASVVIWQNNTAGFLNITGVVGNGKTGGTAYVQAGPGTVTYTGVNTYSGPTYLNGGVTVIVADSGFGLPSSAALLTLDGGTVFGGATFTMDNGGGANPRPIGLGTAGGGLAAVTGKFMTVDGAISGAAGTGPLWIGIAASSANGGVAGLLPGTGANTANTTPTNATGLVVLTGTNTYTGGTALYSGTLSFTSNSLGTGGIAFNGGGLQWAAGTTLDISSQTVSIGAAGGTMDINGNNVTLADSIGNSGSGALIVTNSAGTAAALTLAGSNNYTGGTTVGTGATLIAANNSGSATGTGPVTVQSGGTLEGPGTISGAVTVLPGGVYNPLPSGVGTAVVGSLTSDASSTYDINFNSTPANSLIVVANSGGLTLNGGLFNLIGLSGTGTYDLIQYSGSVGGSGLDSTWTTASDANPHIANPNAAFLYSFGLSGGYLTVTVTLNLSAVIADWTNNVNSVWATAANWSPNRVPASPGDSATLGVSTTLRTVTLNVNETVGVLTFTNPNSFVVAGSGTALTMDNSGATANLNVTAGAANGIQTGVSLNSPVQVTVGLADYLGISGSISNENSSTPQTVLANGAGTLALSGNNSYGPGAGSFGTTLTGGGILQVGSASALGLGDLAVTGSSTLQAGTSVSLANNIDIAPAANASVDTHGNSLALNGTISDAGNITKIGAGALTVGAYNGAYTGTVTVDAGILSISSDGNLGADNPVILNGGDLTGAGNVQIYRNINIGPATGSVGTNAFIDATGGSTSEFSIVGGINSSGNLGINNLTVNGNGGNGIVQLEEAGTFNGTTVVAGGTLDVANSGALQNSLLNYNNQGGVLLFDSSINAATFAGLSGGQNLALTNEGDVAVALTLDGSTSTTYSGSLNDYATGGSLTLTGTATLTLTGSNTMTGELTVDSGELELTNNGSITCSTFQGGEFLVAGGTLISTSATGTSTTLDGTGLVETAGLVQSAGFVRENADGSFIEIEGGTFISSNVNLTRTFDNPTAPTATAPIAGQTTTGFYVTNANPSVPTVVALGTLSIGTGNSSATVRMDGGTFTVTNEVEVGSISAGSTRWTVLQVNGGTFTSLDTNFGIVLSQNNAGAANDAEVYLSGGTTYAGIINFGVASDTAGGNGVVIVTNSSLYMGSGGINESNDAGYTADIDLESGILGATANWSSTIPGDGFSYGLLLPIAGNNFTIQAADASGVAHNISFVAGGLGGPGNLVKTGGGILTLGGLNLFTGTTTVSAGTLALAGDGTTTGFLQGTASVNIIAPGVVSVAGLPDDSLHVGDNNVGQSTQLLTGNGLVSGSVTLGTQGTLAPGISPTNFANFMVASNLTNAGALILKVDHPGTGATNDAVSAQSITNLAGSTLTVTQGTHDLVTGDTFKLLNIAGNSGVSSTTNLLLTLPVTGPVSGVTYVWNTNNLAVNGTIKLTIGATPIPTAPTNVLFSVSSGVLHISWPPGYLGWSLQSNSVSLASPNAWSTIPGSSAVTNENITLPTNGSVFFRMYNN